MRSKLIRIVATQSDTLKKHKLLAVHTENILTVTSDGQDRPATITLTNGAVFVCTESFWSISEMIDKAVEYNEKIGLGADFNREMREYFTAEMNKELK